MSRDEFLREREEARERFRDWDGGEPVLGAVVGVVLSTIMTMGFSAPLLRAVLAGEGNSWAPLLSALMLLLTLSPALLTIVLLVVQKRRTNPPVGQGGDMPAWALHQDGCRSEARRVLRRAGLTDQEEENALALAEEFQGSISELCSVARAL